MENTHNITKKLWNKLSEKQQGKFNELYPLFCDEIKMIHNCNKGVDLDEFTEIIAHNLSWMAVQ